MDGKTECQTPVRSLSEIREASPKLPMQNLWEKRWRFHPASDTLPHVPRKIRQLVSDLEKAGFLRVVGGKGSHRKYVHPRFPGFVLISGHDGDDAQHYQEKHIRGALRKIRS